jgi:uncharacterized protein
MLEKFILSFDDFKKNKNISIKDKAFNFDIDNNIIKSSDIKFSFNAVKYDDIVSVQYNINGYFLLECSRCLEQFKYKVNIDFESSFDSEKYEIDVLEQVRENLILNIPMQPLCKPDCKGLCQVCGKNKNISNCSCEQEQNDEFIAEKWSKIKSLVIGGKNAKSKKKTYSSS